MGPDTPSLPPPVNVPTPEDPAVAEARARQLLADRNAQGRASTVQTSPLGLTDSAPVARKVLLGE